MTWTWEGGTSAVPPGQCSLERSVWPSNGGIWRLFGRGTQYKDPHGCPFNSLPRGTKPSLSLHNSSPLQSILPLPEPRLSGCEWDFVHCSFKSAPVSLTDSRVYLETESSLVFTASCYVNSFSWLLCSWLGSPAWGWDSMFHRGDLYSWNIPLDSQLLHVGVVPALFTPPLSLSVLM